MTDTPTHTRKLGRTRRNWRPFEEARAYVRRLGLRSVKEWWEYCKSGDKPPDIPTSPNHVYKAEWAGWGDWLGTGKTRHKRGGWRAFGEAREFARGLGLKSISEWSQYVKSGNKPDDIPTTPPQVYREDWAGWGDWLGTERIRSGGEWRSFKEAREFARALGLKNTRDWEKYCRSGDRPNDIPSNPNRAYPDEWRGYRDWLGTDNTNKREWRPFEHARIYVRSLGFGSFAEWQEWASSDQRPKDIPAAPSRAYPDKWRGYSDWIGSGHPRNRDWRPFESAQEYVRSMNFSSVEEFWAWCATDEKPEDIPSRPDRNYPDEWIGWKDWLGTVNKPQRTRAENKWRPFEEAREYVRGLNLRRVEEWGAWAASDERPYDIPKTPENVYRDAGWRGFGDWLGKEWRAFEEAREYVRGLGLRNWEEWVKYCKFGQKPDDIPASPSRVYGEWRGSADWLGFAGSWTRTNLLAFLEDLRPRLGDLGETELYLILQQGGSLPGLQKALGNTTALGVLKDLKETDGEALEAALQKAADDEVLEGYGDEEVLEEHTPEEEELHDELLETGGLTSLATPKALRLVDDLAGLHYGLDDETAQYLVDNRVAALWEAYTNNGESALEALQGDGGHYFSLIRELFRAELEGAQNLPIPAGWAFRPPGREEEPPTPPNLMQRRTAHALATRKRLGNWSGVGSGKTLAGILASRITQRRHTLVICNKATVSGWSREIKNAFPDSVVRTTLRGSSVAPHLYTVLNYEKFQQPNRRALVEDLLELGPDFVILDEVQFVKQRDKNASARRQAIHALISELEEQNPDLHVLGMSATPVINTLMEARKLIEIVTGRTFRDLAVQATVNNALAVHRTLKIHGLRYRPRYEIETTVETPTVERNELVDTLRAGQGVLRLEQTLLPPKLEAAREHIRPGTLIYTHYVDGMVSPIRSYVEALGYSTGLYTGEDKTGLEDFLSGRVDVLIGSKPVGTGLDGLQARCDRVLMLSLPWTSAEYEQIIGRVRRQGSAFSSIGVIVPQVRLEHEGDVWSWDSRRMDTIRFKRTLSDCALDGNIPEVARISPIELEERGRMALEAWIERVREGGAAIGVERPRLRIPLPAALTKRLKASRGDFTTLNNRWGSSNSDTVHARLQNDPAEWYLYHTLYREAREGWSEVPALRIAEDLKGRPDLRVGDFGAGECLLRDALPDHDVVSLDHVALDEGVISCDMASTPLKDGDLGAVVFSLSLMGRNWRDYLTEAHRTLKPFGLVFIAEPGRRWEEGELEEALERAGFDPLRSVHRGGFVYARGVRR